MGRKCLSPNQGDGMASMRRKRFAVRMISGPESAFVDRRCPQSHGMVLGVGSVWTSLQAERHPGAAGPRMHVHHHCQGSGAGWLSEACWSWLQPGTSCSALLSGLCK